MFFVYRPTPSFFRYSIFFNLLVSNEDKEKKFFGASRLEFNHARNSGKKPTVILQRGTQ
jgi:predicted lactoylglutathione lyase